MVKKDGQVDHYATAILTTTVVKHGYPCCLRCFANHVQPAGGYLICMHACVHTCVFACMHVCVCVCMCVCTCMHVCVLACMRACLHMCECVWVWVWVCVCVCVCVCGLFLTSKDYGGRVNEPFPTHLCRPVFVKEHSLTSCLWGCFPNGFPQYDWKV